MSKIALSSGVKSCSTSAQSHRKKKTESSLSLFKTKDTGIYIEFQKISRPYLTNNSSILFIFPESRTPLTVHFQ